MRTPEISLRHAVAVVVLACVRQQARHPGREVRHGGVIDPPEEVLVAARRAVFWLGGTQGRRGARTTHAQRGSDHLELRDGGHQLVEGDHCQIRRPNVGCATRRARPCVGFAGIRVRVVGDELLAATQNFQVVFLAEQVREVGAVPLGPASLGSLVEQQGLGGLADTHRRWTEVRQAPVGEQAREFFVLGVDVHRHQRGHSHAGEHADTATRETAEVGRTHENFRPVLQGQHRPLGTPRDGDDAVAVGEHGPPFVAEVVGHMNRPSSARSAMVSRPRREPLRLTLEEM